MVTMVNDMRSMLLSQSWAAAKQPITSSRTSHACHERMALCQPDSGGCTHRWWSASKQNLVGKVTQKVSILTHSPAAAHADGDGGAGSTQQELQEVRAAMGQQSAAAAAAAEQQQAQARATEQQLRQQVQELQSQLATTQVSPSCAHVDATCNIAFG
jgi:hypothetical protein